jgi:hypothetical protein
LAMPSSPLEIIESLIAEIPCSALTGAGPRKGTTRSIWYYDTTYLIA